MIGGVTYRVRGGPERRLPPGVAFWTVVALGVAAWALFIAAGYGVVRLVAAVLP